MCFCHVWLWFSHRNSCYIPEMFNYKELPLGCAVGLGKNAVRFSTDSSYFMFFKTYNLSFLGLQMENVHWTWRRWSCNNVHQGCDLWCQQTRCGCPEDDQGVIISITPCHVLKGHPDLKSTVTCPLHFFVDGFLWPLKERTLLLNVMTFKIPHCISR